MTQINSFTVRSAYDTLHRYSRMIALSEGCSEDRANRIATRLAVHGAWKFYNTLLQECKPSCYHFTSISSRPDDTASVPRNECSGVGPGAYR